MGNTNGEDMQDGLKGVFEPQGEASPQQKKGPGTQSWASEAQASSQTDWRDAVGGGASQAGAGSAEMEAEVRTAPWTTDQQGQGATGTLLPTEEFVSTGVEKEGRRAWRGHLEPCDKGLYSRLESRDLGSPRSLGAVLDIMNCPGAGHSNALVCNPETIFRPTFTGS